VRQRTNCGEQRARRRVSSPALSSVARETRSRHAGAPTQAGQARDHVQGERAGGAEERIGRRPGNRRRNNAPAQGRRAERGQPGLPSPSVGARDHASEPRSSKHHKPACSAEQCTGVRIAEQHTLWPQKRARPRLRHRGRTRGRRRADYNQCERRESETAQEGGRQQMRRKLKNRTAGERREHAGLIVASSGALRGSWRGSTVGMLP